MAKLNMYGEPMCKHEFDGLPEDCWACVQESYAVAKAAAREQGRREGWEARGKADIAKLMGDTVNHTWPPLLWAVEAIRALQQPPERGEDDRG